MKATELRIGNYIEVYYNVSTVVGIQANGNVNAISDGSRSVGKGFNPIKLTDIWLLSLGFKKHVCVPEGLNSSNFILKEFKLNTALPYIQYKSEFIKHIKYVHQLQNLYHALTGEELLIK